MNRWISNLSKVALWTFATTAVGSVIGFALGIYQNEFAWPTFLGSILFANVVGVTVVVVSWVLFPRVRKLPPAVGGALLFLALISGSLLGTAVVVFAFPLFILRDLKQAVAIALLNGLLALVVGGVLWVYEGLRRQLKDSLREVEEIRLKKAELTVQAARAELAALQARINPHFFFNTLNTISSVLQDDPDHAEDLIMQLSELFRYTFRAAGQTVTVQEEVDFIKQYLWIEQARFGDRLQVEFEIDPALAQIQIPGLILQPLVENAIQHGISPLAQGGTISVRAQCFNHNLHLSVTDNGAGLDPTAGTLLKPEHGLDNVVKRLEVLHGSRGSFELQRTNNETVAQIQLPMPRKTLRAEGVL